MTNQWIELGNLDDIPPAGARVVHTPLGNLAVFRTVDDMVFALRDACPHRGGPLSQGMVYGHRVQCPLHGLRVDLDTGEAVMPDEGCVSRYPIRVTAGKVYLSLVEETEREGAA